ncbi:MAG: hypothetical protein Q8P44_03905 [Dehalococcoidia bacterium]|nr:hypothetical protein [Dehalococcoidia bacterium]
MNRQVWIGQRGMLESYYEKPPICPLCKKAIRRGSQVTFVIVIEYPDPEVSGPAKVTSPNSEYGIHHVKCKEKLKKKLKKGSRKANEHAKM